VRVLRWKAEQFVGWHVFGIDIVYMNNRGVPYRAQHEIVNSEHMSNGQIKRIFVKDGWTLSKKFNFSLVHIMLHLSLRCRDGSFGATLCVNSNQPTVPTRTNVVYQFPIETIQVDVSPGTQYEQY
jgi:hypothetical protein